MEHCVSTGERTEADPLIVTTGTPPSAVTDRILELADQAGYRAALIDASDGAVTTWPRFAETVRAAAYGLGRRGLAEGDTAGVFVADAASAAIAVNAIRAAGATACLIGSDAGPADMAARLNACGARLLITSASLAELAAEGADRSRVRQVISFGEAAGTTPFSSLLQSGRHGQPDRPGLVNGCGLVDGRVLVDGHDLVDGRGVADEPGRPEGNGLADQRGLADERGLADRSGPEGVGAWRWPGMGSWPGRAATRPLDEAGLTPASGPALTYRDVVVAAPPCGDGQAYTSLLDLTLLAGATLVAAPLLLVTAAIRGYKGSGTIVPRGTDVPGVPPDRVFSVALSRIAVSRDALTVWRLALIARTCVRPCHAPLAPPGAATGRGPRWGVAKTRHLAARTRWPLPAAAGRTRKRA